MQNIEIKLKSYDNDAEFITKTARDLCIKEREGELPGAIFKMDTSEYKSIRHFDTCEIRRNGRLFFIGLIISFTLLGNVAEVEVTTNMEDDGFPPKEMPLGCKLLEKFKHDNPDLFTSTASMEYSKLGQKECVSLTVPPADPVIMDELAIQDTVKIEVSNESPIGELDLEITGAWLSKREGGSNLSTRIANRFRMAKINTLTPKKLINSWPEFGDRVSKNAKSTKYFINKSKLREAGVVKMPPITISDAIPKLTFNKYLFDNVLSLAWEYDQYMTETFSTKIINNFARHKNKKCININLKNVQEYVDDIDSISFFRGEIGGNIMNEIVKSAGNLIALSMRNVSISFDVVDTEKLDTLDCSNWIIISGITCKITSINRNVSTEGILTKIEAKGFEIPLPNTRFLNTVGIEKCSVKSLPPNDVIEDINIQNEGDKQYEKLLDYISSLKRDKKITKDNYKSLISNFLNENQTRIQIVAKPLKVERCERKFIKIQEPNYFIGGPNK